jgi:hypothetical protein
MKSQPHGLPTEPGVFGHIVEMAPVTAFNCCHKMRCLGHFAVNAMH